MKNHVTSLEVSKELAKILPEGCGGEFGWVMWDEDQKGDPIYNDGFELWPVWEINHYMDCHATDGYEIYPALLLTEVLGLLPMYIDSEKDEFSRSVCESWTRVVRADEIWYERRTTKYNKLEYLGGLQHPPDTRLTDKSARLALWLVENGHELNNVKEKSCS
jgi:hypothetical protein